MSSDTAIRHPALELAIAALRREDARRPDPILAVLGPAGSGKTDLVRAMLGHAARQGGGSRVRTPVRVDLFGIPIASEESMYADVVSRIEEGFLDAGIQVPPRGQLDPARKFDALISQAAKVSGGNLILAFDHFDAVPRTFAASLSQRLRALKERSDETSEVGAVALVVAATISLSELTSSSKSAFQTARVIQLPMQDAPIIREHIRHSLRSIGLREPPDEIVDLLLDETWGEPCFLDVILQRLKSPDIAALTREALTRSIAIVNASEVPHLRHAVLHLHFNRELLNIVQETLKGRRIPRRSQVVDIDEFQLTGVVVLDSRTKPPAYIMRNGMIARLAAEFLRGESRPSDELGLREALRDIGPAREFLLAADRLAECVGPLQRAWTSLTELSSPKLYIAVADAAFSRPYYFQISDDGSDIPPYTARAIAVAHETGEGAFAASSDRVAFALPLPAPAGLFCCMAAALERPQGVFTEYSLQHWRAFIRDVAPSLVRLGLAEAVRHTMAEHRQPKIQDSGAEVRATVQVYLNTKKAAAVVFGPAEVRQIQGTFDDEWVERVHDVDRRLVNGRDGKDEFERNVERAGADVKNVLARMPGLTELFTGEPESQNWVIASRIEGLKIPFELLHGEADKTALLLKTGVARRIDGFVPPVSLRRPFTVLLSRLIESDRKLRVLLVGTDPSEQLPVDEELATVRRKIEWGAAAMKLSCEFVEVSHEGASPAALERALTENGPFHVFHFCGHAYQGSPGSDAGIVLNERGREQKVTSDQIKAWLLGAGLWLCYLSACQTAAVWGNATITSAGMFEDILAAGVPNLVGFRWPVTAKSSLVLAAKFYERLFEPPGGSDLSTAMLYARRAAKGADGVSDAWASSVLITQCPSL